MGVDVGSLIPRVKVDDAKQGVLGLAWNMSAFEERLEIGAGVEEERGGR